MTWPIRKIEKAEAERAVRDAAFTTDDGREVVHSFLGFLGAHHDLEEVVAKIQRADEIAWTTHLIQHDLAVAVDGHVYHYDLERPERIEARRQETIDRLEGRGSP